MQRTPAERPCEAPSARVRSARPDFRGAYPCGARVAGLAQQRRIREVIRAAALGSGGRIHAAAFDPGHSCNGAGFRRIRATNVRFSLQLLPRFKKRNSPEGVCLKLQWLAHQDSNLDSWYQKPESCRWTMGQCDCLSAMCETAGDAFPAQSQGKSGGP